jgi:hypothetical protein
VCPAGKPAGPAKQIDQSHFSLARIVTPRGRLAQEFGRENPLSVESNERFGTSSNGSAI